jgi:mannose-6-phosphate isomerase-like protein (cupin superfamily)
MTMRAIAATALCVLAGVSVHAQRRGAGGTSVTFAVIVTDSAGAPISDVKVALTGSAERAGRTEAGRLVFEGLPAGPYRFRFDKDGYVSLEHELTARGGAPVEVKETLSAAPPPPAPPPAPVAPPPAPERRVDAQPMALDIPTFLDDKANRVGRSPSKVSGLSCTTGGNASLLQINDPVKDQTHPDSDEFLYVVAGEGNAKVGGADEPMSPGMFFVVPRGVRHTFVASKKPLVLLSILAGDKC